MTRIQNFFILSALLSVLSGCSLFGSKESTVAQPTKLQPLENKLDLQLITKMQVGEGSEFSYVKLAPFLLDNQVFAASRDGNVKSYSLETGELLWAVSLQSKLSAGPYAAGNKVYICDSDANVTALDRVSGNRIWQTTLSSEILSRAVESEGYLIIRTADGSIFAIDSETGYQKWVFDRSIPVLTLRGTGDPVIYNGVVYVGLDSGKLVAIDIINGTALWEKQIAIGRGRSEVERIIDIDGTPEIYAGKIFLSSYRSKLGAYSLRDGREFWSRDISSFNGPVVDIVDEGKSIFVTDDVGNIWGISADTGASLWKLEHLFARQGTKPAIFGGYIVVADLEGYVHLIEKTTGKIVARIEVFDSIIRQQPVIYNNYILIQSEEGGIAVVKVSDIES